MTALLLDTQEEIVPAGKPQRPFIIEYFRYWLDPCPCWFCDRVSANDIVTFQTHCEIKTSEGVVRAEVGDYIIRGPKDEALPCRPAAFEAVKARVDELLAKLPVTADGATIVPGMKLYPLHPLSPEDLDGEEDYAVVEFHAVDPFGGEDIDPEDLSKNYSSKDAAAQARTENS